MEIHQIIPILVTLGLAWSGFLVGLIRWLQGKNENENKEALSQRLIAIKENAAKDDDALSQRLTAVENSINKQDEALLQRLGSIEASLTGMRAEFAAMPRSYVLKDDCRRQEDQVLSALAMINRKLDELAKRG
ncbi:MAG TPA: hypothetical protein DCG57_04305 [Candidatus Riflebacteria bacterium]|jgi:hypothetical protein|nr:hypothetical protein [Candidatus Riflebacteria bacterium]